MFHIVKQNTQLAEILLIFVAIFDQLNEKSHSEISIPISSRDVL